MIDLLLFVEDDGAANLIHGFVGRWRAQGLTVVTLATGAAARKLALWQEEYIFVEPTSKGDELLEHWRPRLVAVGTAENRDTLGLLLITAAQRRGVTTVGMVDAYANSQWRWRGRSDNPLAHLPDLLIVADKVTRDVYVALGVPPEIISIIGYVQADYSATARAALEQKRRTVVRAETLPRQAQKRFVIVFVAEQFFGIDPQVSFERRIKEALEKVLMTGATVDPVPYIVLRLHPKNNRHDFAAYEDKINFVSQGGDGLAVVYSGDMVIGSTSTLLFEAALLGRPTLAVLAAVGEHEQLPSIVAGVTPVATTVAEVLRVVDDVRRGTWEIPAGPKLWGRGATERLTAILTNLLVHDSARIN